MTSRNNGSSTGGRDRAGRFATGNPGRPKGARHRTTLAAELLLEGEAEALTRTAIEAALGGDVAAMRLCLDRVVPLRKGRPVAFDIGPIETAADLVSASRRVLEAVAAGVLSPEEAQSVATVVEATRRAIETEDLARRVDALELAHGEAA